MTAERHAGDDPRRHGRIGSLAITNALARGHEIVVLSRQSTIGPSSGRVEAIVGDVADPDALRLAVTGSVAVIAALGPRTNTLEDGLALGLGMRHLVAAMEAKGVSRPIALSGAAVDVPGDAQPVIDRIASRIVRLAARHVVGAKQREFDVFSVLALAWTALRPPIVTDGDGRGYRLSEHLSPGARVTRADVATAMVAQLDDDSFVRRAPFVPPLAKPDEPEPADRTRCKHVQAGTHTVRSWLACVGLLRTPWPRCSRRRGAAISSARRPTTR